MNQESPDISLDELRAAVMLAAHQHFGRAAEALRISQPALTRKIRLMEERLGGRLFERHARGVALTPAGACLCERGRRLLEEAARTEELTRRVLQGSAGMLRVGAGLTTLLSGLPQVLRAFRRAHPEVHLTVRDMSSSDQLTALRRGEIDVGFMRMPAEAAGIEVEALVEDELKLACSTALWPARPRDHHALWANPFLILSRATSATFHDHVLATCRAAGYTPRVTQEANQLLTILTLVQSGIGISLVPASSRVLRLAHLRLLDLRLPEASWTVGMAWHRESFDSTPARHFLPLARRHFRP